MQSKRGRLNPESFMKTKLNCLFMMLALLVGQSALATVTFTITPSAISNTFVGAITLQINGLTNGEHVIVDHYVDLNSNGIIETNDLLMGHFLMTDGQRAVIGGVTNLNVPGDLTGTNGAITALVNDYAPQLQLPVGAHLFRLSSPSGHFPSLTNSFTITNWPFAQTIKGVVKSGSTNLANALVVIQRGVKSGIAGVTVADSSGNYSFRAPAGNYAMIPFKSGYVMSGSLSVLLATNATVTTNFAMIPATRTLSGRLADSANTNLGLPGILVVWQSVGGAIVVCTTDTNGNFTAPVTSDIWNVKLQQRSGLPALGYIIFSGEATHNFDTTTGSVTTASITVPKGNAMFYGTIKNNLNAPMPGVEFSGYDQYTKLYSTTGWSDTNGNYCAVTTTNNWSIGVSSDDPIFRSYVVSSGNSATLSSNQAVRVDFLAEPMTGVITGNVSSATGPVIGLLISGNASVGNNNLQSYAITDGNGNYSFAVFNGNWDVLPNCCCGSGALNTLGYNCTSDQQVTVSSARTTVNFTVYPLGTAVLSDPGWIGDGQFGFTMSGTSGGNYYVQVSTNLTDWSTITNFTLSGDSTFIEDDQATNSPRFYRSVLFSP